MLRPVVGDGVGGGTHLVEVHRLVGVGRRLWIAEQRHVDTGLVGSFWYRIQWSLYHY